jgi:hypothetical protein
MRGPDGVEVINKNDPNRLHKIRTAVYEGVGWRYAGQSDSIVYMLTSGRRGLSAKDLEPNQDNTIVSKKRSALGKQQMKRLREANQAAPPFKAGENNRLIALSTKKAKNTAEKPKANKRY